MNATDSTSTSIPSPRSSFLLTSDHILAQCKAMEAAGMTVERDWNAGTVKATAQTKVGTITVYRAIQKGHRQPWIVTHVRNLFA